MEGAPSTPASFILNQNVACGLLNRMQTELLLNRVRFRCFCQLQNSSIPQRPAYPHSQDGWAGFCPGRAVEFSQGTYCLTLPTIFCGRAEVNRFACRRGGRRVARPSGPGTGIQDDLRPVGTLERAEVAAGREEPRHTSVEGHAFLPFRRDGTLPEASARP